ncbi:MAG: hypothetical protein H6751_15785 [Candidatus Omnitrophica bacterium]|nr:hypothetical protein [Candidatus Omnitrophota bacterium]
MNSVALVVAALCAVVEPGARAETEDLGNGFFHHGVATPVSNHRGTVATVDGEGRDVALVWLFDHRGGYALLMIDAETGKSQEFPMPFDPGGDCPYSSVLSSKNKFYTHFNNHFVEFDPEKPGFTFHHATAPQMAMSMTEDDNGVIWSVTYPSSGVVSFNPETREFKDYGHVHDENWRQYQRSVVTDDTGWVYFGVGNTSSQIIAFDPKTEEAKTILPEDERVTAMATVYRDKNGKVYGHTGSGEKDDWYELYRGESKKITEPESIDQPKVITSSQALFHREFPDGKILKACDLVDRKLVVEDPASGEVRELDFDYTSEGAHIMGIAVAPDGTLCGGTAFPMRFFSYDPKTDEWVNRESYHQWNTVARAGDRFFVGGYGGGFLLEWDPSKEWAPTVKGKEDCNPRYLTECTPVIHRPHDLLPYPDGKTVVLAGTPGYGYTGGGLLFWNRETEQAEVVEHAELLPDQSTQSLAALPDRKILGGSTTSAGTGGEVKAKQAELYILDLDTKKIEWHEPLFPGVQGYTDLWVSSDGLAYGVADQKTFFVFDPIKRKVIHQQALSEEFGPTTSQQGPRVFVASPEGDLYMLFRKGVGQVDLKDYGIKMLADSPVTIGPGGDYLDGKIYFGSGSHLYSYQVPTQ